MHHFIRGFFDGDGSITLLKNSNAGNLSFTACVDFLQELDTYIVKNLNIKPGGFSIDHRCDSRVQSLRYTKRKDILFIKNYLYQDSCFCLSRKKEKFEIIEEKLSLLSKTNMIEIKESYLSLNSISKVAKIFGCSNMFVYDKLKELYPDIIRKREISKEKEDLIIYYNSLGFSVKQISDIISVSTPTIHSRLNKLL